MSDVNIWRAIGAKELLAYISSAKGEQHDAVVYDTGYEFDADSPDAVRFVASVAMTKASENTEDFIVEMPKDGSVVSRFDRPISAILLRSMHERTRRENTSAAVYVPDSDEYCDCLQNALEYRRIHFDDMTETERKMDEAETKGIERANWWYVAIRVYPPIILAVFGLIYIIVKLSQ